MLDTSDLSGRAPGADGGSGGLDASDAAPAPPDALVEASVPVPDAGDASSADGAPGDAAVVTYRGEVMADRPIAFYMLAETSGTTAQDEVGSHPGTYVVNAPGSLQLGQPGPGPGTFSARFAGGRVTANSVAQLPNGTFAAYTVEAFVSSEVPAGSSQFYVTFAASGGGGGPSLFIDDATRGPKVAAHGSSVSANAAFTTAAWHHVAVTVQGTTASIYVDGALDVTGAIANPTPERAFFTIGASYGTSGDGGAYGNAFTGRLADVAIYASALSAGRVAAHYAARPR